MNGVQILLKRMSLLPILVQFEKMQVVATYHFFPISFSKLGNLNRGQSSSPLAIFSIASQKKSHKRKQTFVPPRWSVRMYGRCQVFTAMFMRLHLTNQVLLLFHEMCLCPREVER